MKNKSTKIKKRVVITKNIYDDYGNVHIKRKHVNIYGDTAEDLRFEKLRKEKLYRLGEL